MKLNFKNIFNKTLKPTWDLDLDEYKIWKILPTEDNILVCEARNTEKKEMFLFGIDITSGKNCFDKITFDEKWWVALELIIGRFVVLHKFPKPDMPNVMGVYIIDSQNGNLLWKNEKFKVLNGKSDTAIAQIGSGLDKNEFLKIDLNSGSILENYGNNFELCINYFQDIDNSNVWESWVSAEVIKPDTENFHVINSILGNQIKDQRGVLNYVEFRGYSIITASERSKKNAHAMLSNYTSTTIFIFDKDGKLIFKELLSENTNASNEDTFFIWNSTLVFIKNSNKLVGMNLDMLDD